MVKMTIPCKAFSQSIGNYCDCLVILHHCTLNKLKLPIVDRQNNRTVIANAVNGDYFVINMNLLFRTAKTLYDNGGLTLRNDALVFLEQLKGMTMEDVWAQARTKGDMDREKLMEWFLYLNMLLRDMLVLYEDGASPLLYHQDCRQRLAELLPGYPESQIFAMLSLVRETQRRLQANVNLRLQMEGFFIRIMDCRKA